MRHRDSVMTVQTMITGSRRGTAAPPPTLRPSPPQPCSAVVLGLGLLDAASRYFEFVDMNKTGTRSTTLFVMALIFRASKRTLSRAVVLMVALGYGVSKCAHATPRFASAWLTIRCAAAATAPPPAVTTPGPRWAQTYSKSWASPSCTSSPWCGRS